MKKEEIHLNDFQRILFGESPAAFLVEVLIRTIIIYLTLLVVLRLMGKRMDGQISIIEMAIMILMGAIVGVGTQVPERGILPAVVAFICVFIFQRSLNWLNVKSEKAEVITNGAVNILVRDGILQLEEMRAAHISRQNLFAYLRSRSIFNLGKIKRVYFEGCGLLNVYEYPKERPGLALLPPGEDEFIREKTRQDQAHVACTNCGWVDQANARENPCPNCGSSNWTTAIY